MADQGDLDIDGEGRSGSSSQQVRKNINLKLKSSPKGKGARARKPAPATRSRKRTVEEEEPPEPQIDSDDEVIVPSMKPLPGEPVHQDQRLNWDHKVQLIGEKVLDPAIHCCEKCNMPILIYGRMIPCKHVFCFDCAKKTEKNCPRCNDAVIRIEQSALGTVFVCRFGGSKHGVNGCRRTYLSQRDLQAHIDHRHLKTKPAGGHSRASSHSGQSHSAQQVHHHSSSSHSHQSHGSGGVMSSQHQPPMVSHQAAAPSQQGVGHDSMMYQRQTDVPQVHHAPPQQNQPSHHQPVPQQGMSHMPPQDPYHAGMDQQQIHSRAASNLISVPIQDEANRHQQAPSSQSGYQGQSYSHSGGSYPQSQGAPQQHYPAVSQARHAPHSSYSSSQYNPPPQQQTGPPQQLRPHGGGGAPRPGPGGPPPPARYSGGSHGRPYDEQYGRGATQPRAPSNSSGMGPPPSRQYY